MTLAPTSLQAQALSHWLEELVTDWESSLLPWLPAAASIVTLFFLGFMGKGVSLSAKVREIDHSRAQLIDEEEATRRELRDLSNLDGIPLPQAVELLAELNDDALAALATQYRDGPGTPLLDPRQHAAGQAHFRDVVDALDHSMQQTKANAGAQIDRLHESVVALSSRIARLQEMIARERERIRRHQELTGIVDSLAEKIAKLRRRFRVRELAIDLLHGAIRYIAQRFNTEVRNLSANSLPKLTNGRYEHLQIDENLKVKAFSNEKRDFMDLDEISSGTQRQIMLAVRLSLSQKLVNSVIQGPQMLFLDEPFAFFDERRTASALHILPQVSADFTQIWVTSQTFPLKSRFDLYVECNADVARSPLVERRMDW